MFKCLSFLCFPHRSRHRIPLTFIILGLDNAGKTTLLSALKGQLDNFTTPTWGFNSEVIQLDKYELTFYDLGGGPKIRDIWPNYYPEVHGIVYVFDSSDPDRIQEARSALLESLEHECMQNKPLLVLINKQDKQEAQSAGSVIKSLDLNNSVENNTLKILPCSAKSKVHHRSKRDNIGNGMKWLLSEIEDNYAEITSRVEKDSAAARERLRKEQEERRRRVMERKEERGENTNNDNEKIEEENDIEDDTKQNHNDDDKDSPSLPGTVAQI
eukprot:gb/GECH01012855.1/.p1 GENE.gb/GECH01012855.1/~~gb/GECH01012855.1/.p1  ORF type:complete len:270 (+),score=64.55 gb/GECH01012855.1/:1-810(+)